VQSATLRLMPTHARNVTMLAESYLLAGGGDDAAREIERGLGLAWANRRRCLEAEGCRIKSEVVPGRHRRPFRARWPTASGR
jgi:hypothetical protein